MSTGPINSFRQVMDSFIFPWFSYMHDVTVFSSQYKVNECWKIQTIIGDYSNLGFYTMLTWNLGNLYYHFLIEPTRDFEWILKHYW